MVYCTARRIDSQSVSRVRTARGGYKPSQLSLGQSGAIMANSANMSRQRAVQQHNMRQVLLPSAHSAIHNFQNRADKVVCRKRRNGLAGTGRGHHGDVREDA